MADLVFNIAKGRAAYYATLPATNDALICVPIEATGLETDETLKDYDNLSVLLAGTSNEQTANMTRKTLAGVTVTVDDTGGNNWVNIDATDPTWTAATGNAIACLIICYDPDTTGGTDADLIPLVKLDCAMTPDGSDFTAQFAATGFYRAT
jgi:hypothetical protein